MNLLRPSHAPMPRPLRHWLYLCALMVIIMIVIGGVTRLTGAGLAMTTWKPITGIIPPLSHEEWRREFEQYQNYPEYRTTNASMNLEAFKTIYLIEYSHRLWGRILGLIFLLPFLWFLIKKQLRSRELYLLSAALALGISQAFVGWWMVQSGLIHEPQVSHLRLALHFGIANIILMLLIITARPIGKPPPTLYLLAASFFITMMAGNFVAGLDGGTIYNSFPLMNGFLLPPDLFALTPLSRNLIENPVLWQWFHRISASITLILVWWIFSKMKNTPIHALILITAIALTIQFSLGIITLLAYAPPYLASLHQTWGIITFTITLAALTHEHHQK